MLTLKALSKIVANDILNFVLLSLFKNVTLGISCELSAKQMIYMRIQVLFSLFFLKKKKKNNIKILFAAVVISTLRVESTFPET